jgi:hypothetical protein
MSSSPSLRSSTKAGVTGYRKGVHDMMRATRTALYFASLFILLAVGCGSGGSGSAPGAGSRDGWIQWSGNAHPSGKEWVTDNNARAYRFSSTTGVLNDGTKDLPNIKVVIRSAPTVFLNGVSFGTIALVQSTTGRDIAGLLCTNGTIMIINSSGSTASCSTTTPAGTTATTGGGGGSATTTWSNQFNSCLTVATTPNQPCGQGSLTVRYDNNCNNTFEIFVCLQRTDGTWDCGRQTLGAGRDDYYWTCSATGTYKIFTDADSTKPNPTP